MKYNPVEFLDCTLRDGGYYNNWNFNKELINKYLKEINKIKIKYIELGFRTLYEKKIKGNTAYTTDNFIKSLKIPKNLKMGVMINAADILESNLSSKKICRKLFPNVKNTKVNFVRLACHIHEPFKIINVIKWLKKNNFMVTINLMQISEINKNQIRKLCKFLKKLNVDVLYLADSLGSLRPKETLKLTKLFKKYWDGDLGIHAHNNMKLALSNSIEGNKNGIKWIDSTVSGMGRGPGNVRTEDLITYFSKKLNKNIKIKSLKDMIAKYFLPLKKKYNWGHNKYYYISGKNKIHPTYIQEILSDKRYSRTNYLKIINNLKESDTKKYNPYKLLSSLNFYNAKPKGYWSPVSLLSEKNILILGPGNTVVKNKKILEKFIKKNNIFVICLNTVSDISNSLINLRVACHPLRILSDAFFHQNSKNNLAVPVSMIPPKVYDKIKSKNKKIFDYGLTISRKKTVTIKKKYCILPNQLAIGYSLAIAISGKAKKIFLAGFDGYKIDDPHNDETNQTLQIFKKKYKNIILTSLTSTKYNISFKPTNSVNL